ncbi:MbnP family copper-binding protein [Novispirillum itersonii]|uniref:Putative repeat protein (TIGR04052 family) n=1 Tax=Novispirillum itersonii TaxID=189 RepID=A0A7W9ZHW0_NOVIT|nr:MbnP family copper-binding protein [Novispirillum itersonii]MBB6211776.1 putative repeat protein (TIGR04052 family) [Novispirillum itersonii]
MRRSARFTRGLAALALGAVTLTACATPPGPQTVRIPFTLTAGATPVQCGTPFSLPGSGGPAVTLRDARLYVQDIALIEAGGTAVPLTLTDSDWQRQGVALLDFESGSPGCAGNAAVNTAVTGTVPAGSYTGLRFTVGVPPALNHTSVEVTPAPLDVVAMNWSWQAGRKFMKVEVNPAGGVRKPDGATAPTWFLHLGSTDCTGNPVQGGAVTCQRPNRLPVTLPAFDPVRQAVALDLAALFRGTDLTRDQGGAVGCMSGPTDADCPPVFAALGLSLTTGQPLAPPQPPVFRPVEAR